MYHETLYQRQPREPWHSSEMGLYEVPCDESLPGMGIGMTNEVFQIDGRRQDLRESLQSAVRCSVARGPRFFKWKMLSVRAVCSATPTALDCTGDLVAGERFRLL